MFGVASRGEAAEPDCVIDEFRLKRLGGGCRRRGDYFTWFFCYQDTAGDGGGYGIKDSSGAPKGVYFDTVAALV